MMILGASTALTFTLNSLASSATVGRQSAIIDFTGGGIDDCKVSFIFKNGSSAVGAGLGVTIYLLRSQDGTNWEGSNAEAAGGGDSAMTIDAVTNLRPIWFEAQPAANGVYNVIMDSIAALCGGVLPCKIAFCVVQNTTQALASSGNSAAYRTLTY